MRIQNRISQKKYVDCKFSFLLRFVCLSVCTSLMVVLFCLWSFQLSSSIKVYFLNTYSISTVAFLLFDSFLFYGKQNYGSFLFSFAIISFEMFLLNFHLCFSSFTFSFPNNLNNSHKCIQNLLKL
jgi:hypothetical protein